MESSDAVATEDATSSAAIAMRHGMAFAETRRAVGLVAILAVLTVLVFLDDESVTPPAVNPTSTLTTSSFRST